MLHALRDVLNEPQLREMGKSFEAAKQHVPTRCGNMGICALLYINNPGLSGSLFL